MVYTGADLFIDILESYGVSYIFGNPGTTELPVMQSLEKTDIEYILALHEDIAVGMAAGYANTLRYYGDKNTNPVGVVNLHVSPGLGHGIGNIHGAKFAGSPLIITAGNHSTDFRHEEPILSGDLIEMVDQFTKWSTEVLDVDTLPTILRRAFRTALTPPTGPVFISLPMNVMMEKTDEEPEKLGKIPNKGIGDPRQIDLAADLLVEAHNPVIIVGDHIARSGTDAIESAVKLAEKSGARVHGEILTSEVNFPTDHSQWISHIPPDEEIARSIMQTDTIVLVGCSTNTTLFRHKKDLVDSSTVCIHINDDSWNIGKNQSAQAAIIGDPGLVMERISNKLENRISEGELQKRLKRVDSAKKEFKKLTNSSKKKDKDFEGIPKSKFIDIINKIAEDAYIVDEGVTSKYALLENRSLNPQKFLSNKGGGLGYGLPASIGASLAEELVEKNTKVVGFIGDGSYLYYPHAIYTAVRYDIDLTVIVADNRSYHVLKENMMKIYGEYEHKFIGMDINPRVDIPQNAESNGARGYLIKSTGKLSSVLSKSLEKKGVDVLDVLIQT